MKILFYNHTGQVSGAERVLLLILAQLNHDRFEPLLLCPSEGELRNNAKAVGVRCETINSLEARFTWRPQLLFRYLCSFISVMLRVRARVRESAPELIHANSIRAGLVMSAATVGLKVPIIWHVHDLLPPHPISTLIRVFVLLFPPVRIVTVSQVAADRLRGKLLSSFGKRVTLTVIHNAVDTERLRKGGAEKKTLHKELRLRGGDPLIGIVGNLSVIKGQLSLISAFADVLKQIPDAALLIVGSAIFNRDDDYNERLIAHAKALGIADRVRFLGQRNDVPTIVSSLDLLVLNSTSEACPLVALEGLACGAPVLSTAVGGVPELIAHGINGWLIPSGDQQQLSQAIVSLIQQPELRAQLAANGRRHVTTNFTVQKFMTSLEKVFANCAAKSVQTKSPESSADVPSGLTVRPGKQRKPDSRIAVFHDNFAQMGGAEKVAEEIYSLLPNATLHTTASVPEVLSNGLRNAKIKTSWMQFLPGLRRHFRHYFLFYPFAVESVDLSRYDLIVSSCFGYAKGVRKRRDAVHVCYCHTPMRWVWRYEDYSARADFGRIARTLLPLLLAVLKRWDLRASRQPDYFIANSHVVAERIKKFYGRESIVIPPPIDVSRFQNEITGEIVCDDYYLILSRLVPYKRIDLAVKACAQLNRPLLIIGDGPDRARLESLAGPQVRFLGRQSDEAVARYAARCRALIFPGEEDFGMTPLEVNAAGRPVIAFRGGGALETVVEGVTGVFFNEPSSPSLAQAIQDFELRSWNPARMRAHAARFDRTVFASRLLEFLRTVAPAVELEANAAWQGFATFPSSSMTEPPTLPGLVSIT
jgi:glycosyltransferase involved in cell wall biosynthesis